MAHDLHQRIDGHAAVAHLVDRSDEDVLVALDGHPALLRLPGRGSGPRPGRLLSCLLHGNEDSGYRAVLDLLRSRPVLADDLWVLIGNVRAATEDGWFAHRHLDDQEDFNRVWGLDEPTTRMRRCADAVLAELVAEARLVATVDLHNNTGLNPYYAVVPEPSPQALHLAAVCADTALLWPMAAHTLMEALIGTCPAVALEAGLPFTPANTAYVRDRLDAILTTPAGATGRRPGQTLGIDVRITVRPEIAMAVGGPVTDDVDLVLTPGLEAHNFGTLVADTELGRVPEGAPMPLRATTASGDDVTAAHLAVTDDGTVMLTDSATPVMWTADPRQIRRDCLGYLASPRDGVGLAEVS